MDAAIETLRLKYPDMVSHIPRWTILPSERTMLHSRDGDAGSARFCGVRSRQRTIYFSIDSAVPKPGLDATAAAMRSAFADEQLVITGHADDPGPADFNNQLALARAEHVALELISEGLGYERLILANLDRGCPQRITDPGLFVADNRRVTVSPVGDRERWEVP